MDSRRATLPYPTPSSTACLFDRSGYVCCCLLAGLPSLSRGRPEHLLGHAYLSISISPSRLRLPSPYGLLTTVELMEPFLTLRFLRSYCPSSFIVHHLGGPSVVISWRCFVCDLLGVYVVWLCPLPLIGVVFVFPFFSSLVSFVFVLSLFLV